MITEPRCSKHKKEKTLPALCHTCQRINVEHLIVTKVVDDLFAAGYVLYEREDENVHSKESRDSLLNLLFDLDDAYLIVLKPEEGRDIGFVYFVFGNDGYDVINDYSMNLEDALQGANDLASTFDV